MNHLSRTIMLLAPWLSLSACAGGCHGLTPGKMEWVQVNSESPRAGNVYLMRGWIGVFSTGVDELSQKLNERGVRANVYQETQYGALAKAIAQDYRGAGGAEPLVLIGHSYGADNVVRAARALEREGVQVDLLITLDPTTPPKVPRNVRLCYNYYQPQATDFIPLFRGVPLKSDDGATGKLVNLNLRKERRDLLAADTNHINIDKNPKVHEAVVLNVLEVCPDRRQWLAGRGNSPTTAEAKSAAGDNERSAGGGGGNGR
jgi:hypothetical protein